MSSLREEALLALAAKGEAEQNLAKLPLCPPIRHAAFAAIVAALVAVPALSVSLRFVAIALIFLGVVFVVQWDKRRLGVFINGYRRGKTRMVTFPMLAVILGLYFASSYCSVAQKGTGVILALAGLAFVIGYVGSTLWQRVFLSELNAK